MCANRSAIWACIQSRTVPPLHYSHHSDYTHYTLWSPFAAQVNAFDLQRVLALPVCTCVWVRVRELTVKHIQRREQRGCQRQ